VIVFEMIIQTYIDHKWWLHEQLTLFDIIIYAMTTHTILIADIANFLRDVALV